MLKIDYDSSKEKAILSITTNESNDTNFFEKLCFLLRFIVSKINTRSMLNLH